VRFFSGARAGGDSEDWRPSVSIRRVIGLPGDSVRMEDYIFYVRPGGSAGFESEFEASGVRYPLIREGIPETWTEDLPFGTGMDAVELGPDQYFLASDDRVSGLDSRHRGAVSEHAFLSRVVLRYWPASRLGRP
jgi:signal peptidase I